MSQKLDFFIIDDSDVNNYYIEDLLEEFEFTNSVNSFMKASEALDELLARIKSDKKLPDVIFLDIRMPEMDGFEFIEELENELDDAPFTPKVFILTSSRHRRDVEAFSKQFIACEFLNKPLEKEVVSEMLVKHFDGNYPSEK